MSNQVNLNGELLSADDYLAKAQALPQNTNADGNGGAFEIADTMASLEVVVKVNSEITLANTKAITVKLQQSSDNGDDDAFADLSTLYTHTNGTGDAETIAADTELARYLIPTDAERYIKANIATTDASAAGKVDIFLRYIPR